MQNGLPTITVLQHRLQWLLVIFDPIAFHVLCLELTNTKFSNVNCTGRRYLPEKIVDKYLCSFELPPPEEY